jgi:predicted choloylglycine hydrolase
MLRIIAILNLATFLLASEIHAARAVDGYYQKGLMEGIEAGYERGEANGFSQGLRTPRIIQG